MLNVAVHSDTWWHIVLPKTRGRQEIDLSK